MKISTVKRGTHIAASAALVTVSFLMKETMGYAPATIAVMVASTLVAGIPIFRKAFGALRYKIVGIDALVTIAVTGAFIIGEYWEAAAVTFLFTFGDYLEARTIEKTRSSIKSLLDLAPRTARVRRGGLELEVDPEQVVKGDLVVVRPGERIAVDGRVVEGSAFVNQAAVTGESLPVERGPDGKVFSGTVLESGYLIIEAERVGEDTTFARILRMVEDAQDSKARTQKFLEKFSRWYTPAVVLLSAALYILTGDLRLALTLLVIACPGALVISAPVSIVAGIGNGAKRGVLVKGGEIMEKLGTVKAVAFDKTGTLTVGKPSVVAVRAMNSESGEAGAAEVLRIAAAGEAFSEHPLAAAIVRKAGELSPESGAIAGGGVFGQSESHTMIAGKGVLFRLGGREYAVGNRALLAGEGIDFSSLEAYLEAEESLGRTVVLVGAGKNAGAEAIGAISIADTVRPEARQLVERLRSLGVAHVSMLTGDNARAAQAIARETGLDSFRAELLPEDKVAALKALGEEYGSVAMVGDGINDAPALASADLGVAIGGAGADVAMETADVVLMSDDVRALAYAVGLSRATVRNMKQNIGFALLVAGSLLAGVLVRTVNLSFGMLVHEASVLLVIVNAVRLLGYKERR